MKTMKDYYDLYLTCGALLLVNVFKKFRNDSLKNYGLFPGLYLRAPGLSWDAMLKMTKIELQLIADPDIYVLFEKGTRDKTFYIPKRHSKANNKDISYYDLKQEVKHIIYLYASNLYGYAMSNFFQRVDSIG